MTISKNNIRTHKNSKFGIFINEIKRSNFNLRSPISKWICQETMKNRQTTFPPPLWHIIPMKLYAKYNPIESELSRNKAKQKDNITNYLYKNDDTSFPTHSDTHFLSKYVENLTPFQIKLSRKKEKQIDNIQTTLILLFNST